jgi:hypothetical protein
MTLILLGCEKEPENGHLKLNVTYPEAVVENGMLYFIPVPGVGAEARLYEKQARCIGYKNAGFGIAHIGENSVQSLYVSLANEKGEILFEDIEAGEYYLTVYARQQYKYTQKYIEIPSGDTLRLNKDFTPELSFFEDLEPWDYEMPEY